MYAPSTTLPSCRTIREVSSIKAYIQLWKKNKVIVIRKTIIDKFQEHLLIAYGAYCAQHQLPESLPGLITFLIDKDVISPPQIKRLAVYGEYVRRTTTGEKSKTSTIKDIANLLNISERYTWSLLKYELERQRKK